MGTSVTLALAKNRSSFVIPRNEESHYVNYRMRFLVPRNDKLGVEVDEFRRNNPFCSKGIHSVEN